MKVKQVIPSMIPFKGHCSLYLTKKLEIFHYENNSGHIGFLTKKTDLYEVLRENQLVKIYRNGKPLTLDYSIGINHPIEEVSLFESYRIDTTGKFLYLRPLGKNVEAAYWMADLTLEIQPDIYGADATMAGGIIIE